MRRLAGVIAVILGGCSSPRDPPKNDDPPPSEKEPEAVEVQPGIERPEAQTDPEAPTAPDPPPTPELPPPAEVPAAKDPLAVLMTPGNRWTYRVYYGWHASYWSIYEITREVTDVEQLGPYQIATIKQTVTPSNDENDGSDSCVRIRKGDQTWLFEWDYDGPATAAAMRKMLADEEPEMDLGVAQHESVCSFVGCFGGRTRSFGIDSWAGFWPGVGIVTDVRADYSPETGDGNTRHMMLTGFELTGPVPTLHPGEEPAELATVREKVHAVAIARDLTALRKLIPETFWYSLHDEHRWDHGVEEDWKGLEAGWKVLAESTRSPCKTLDTDPMIAACPAPVAQAHANATGRAKYPASETKPRAYFERTEKGWVPRGVFLGGPADVFWLDEASDDPARPLKAYALPEKN